MAETVADRDDELFWRDEVLEALYWMQGEGIAETVDADGLERFLQGPRDRIAGTLEDLVGTGHVERADGGYALTDKGRDVAGRVFHDDFGDIQGFGASHTQCGPDCWCHDVDHADDPCPGDEHDHEAA